MPELSAEDQRRIELTVAVRDTDPIAKVEGAGSVIERDGRRVQVMHNGVLVVADGYYGAWVTEVIRQLRGHHEPQEELAVHAIVERLREERVMAPVAVGLGSYWGYYSLWVAHAIPLAQCLMVEPDPNHLEVGRRNAALNDVAPRLLQAAAGAEHGSMLRLACESDGVRRRVGVVTLDGLMVDHALERVEVLFCDVQGAELDVLRGVGRALADRRLRFLVLSTHHHSISGDALTHQRCLEKLAEFDAHVIAEHSVSVSESCSGDGLIVASMDPRDADLRVEVTHVRARDSLFGEVERELAVATTWRAAGVRLASDARRLPGRIVRRR